MGGGTGNIRTGRISATGGYRTIGSMIANGASSGAGSCRRVIAWYARNGFVNNNGTYGATFDIKFGQFRDRAQWFISNVA